MRHTDPIEARAAAEAAASLRQLNERSREVFKRIVESYLATGEPVGSRNLSRALPMTLSPPPRRRAVEDVLGEAGEMLSGLSRCAGVVLVDKQSKKLKHVEFVNLGPGRAL